MSKISKLVKQAELFERLAVFGNRSSFLKSLAQNPRDQVTDSQMHASLEALDKAIGSWISSHGESQPGLPSVTKGIPSSLWNAANTVKSLLKLQQYNVDHLAQAQSAARQLAAVLTFKDMSGDGKQAWMQLVSPAASTVMDNVQKQKSYLASFPAPEPLDESKPAPTNQVATNTTPAAAAKPAAPKYKSISKDLQDKLNRILVPDGSIFILERDGSLGPKTMAALEKFKEKYNVPGNYNTDEVLEVLQKANV